MKYFSFSLIVFSLVVLFQSCGNKEISDPKVYLNWLGDSENGLVNIKYINGVKITVKYLPPQLQAYQELNRDESISKMKKDSLINYYSRSKSFLLTLGPDERKEKNSSDIMWRGVTKFEEYKERNLTMNFEMSEYITLETDKGIFKPVLTNMENTYSLSNDRKIYIVFSDDDKENQLNKAEEMDLIFHDEIFNTGINHFVFKKEYLDKVPNFIF